MEQIKTAQTAQNMQSMNVQSVHNNITGVNATGANAEQAMKNRPEKKFQAGTLSITVWKNSVLKDGKQLDYRTISVGRSYKKNGAWQNSTASVRVNDLPKLSLMMGEAYKYLVMQTRDTNMIDDENIIM